MTTGAAAIHIALEAKRPEPTPSPDKEALSRIAISARAAEAATLTGYVRMAGEASQPLKKGVLAPYFWGGVVGAGLVLPEILEHLPAPPRARRWLTMAASVGRLAGAFALRTILLKAGYVTANDPKAARAASRPQH
jgi:formate-dependent nitrite reductase membrane component NrfD